MTDYKSAFDVPLSEYPIIETHRAGQRHQWALLGLPDSHSLMFATLWSGVDERTGALEFADGMGDFSPNPDLAERIFHGFVKWDGCVNFDLGDDDGCMSHLCGLDQARVLGEMWDAIYACAAKHVGAFDRKCAGMDGEP